MFSGRLKLKHNVYVFFICLTLAFFFWLLNVLAKQYTAIVDIPVRYQNFPSDRVVINELPETFAAMANVSGYNLLFSELKNKEDTIVIDGKTLNNIRKNKINLSYFLVNPVFKKLVAKSYGAYKITDILTDTLFIKFDKKITKAVPVKANLSVNMVGQHLLKGVKIFPEVLKLVGPKAVLDTISELHSDSLYFKQISENTTNTLTFSSYNNLRVELKPSKSIITLEVEKITEKILELPIVPINVPDNIKLKTFPNKIKATVLVPLGNYGQLSTEDFKIVVDYNEIRDNASKLKVNQFLVPDFVSVTKIEPSRVEYIIKK